MAKCTGFSLSYFHFQKTWFGFRVRNQDGFLSINFGANVVNGAEVVSQVTPPFKRDTACVTLECPFSFSTSEIKNQE